MRERFWQSHTLSFALRSLVRRATVSNKCERGLLEWQERIDRVLEKAINAGTRIVSRTNIEDAVHQVAWLRERVGVRISQQVSQFVADDGQQVVTVAGNGLDQRIPAEARSVVVDHDPIRSCNQPQRPDAVQIGDDKLDIVEEQFLSRCQSGVLPRLAGDQDVRLQLFCGEWLKACFRSSLRGSQRGGWRKCRTVFRNVDSVHEPKRRQVARRGKRN